jgi:hypothetical protein
MGPGSRPGRRGWGTVRTTSISIFQSHIHLHILATRCARGLLQFHPLRKQRAQGRPGARCTRGLVCKHAQKNAHEHTGSAESIRPSLRNGFTAYSALFPATGLFATVASQTVPRSLTPASGRQNHTISPSASAALVSRSIYVHRISTRVSLRSRAPLLSGETGGETPLICPTRQEEYFSAEGWTGFFDLPVGQFPGVRGTRFLPPLPLWERVDATRSGADG